MKDTTRESRKGISIPIIYKIPGMAKLKAFFREKPMAISMRDFFKEKNMNWLAKDWNKVTKDVNGEIRNELHLEISGNKELREAKENFSKAALSSKALALELDNLSREELELMYQSSNTGVALKELIGGLLAGTPAMQALFNVISNSKGIVETSKTLKGTFGVLKESSEIFLIAALNGRKIGRFFKKLKITTFFQGVFAGITKYLTGIGAAIKGFIAGLGGIWPAIKLLGAVAGWAAIIVGRNCCII